MTYSLVLIGEPKRSGRIAFHVTGESHREVIAHLWGRDTELVIGVVSKSSIHLLCTEKSSWEDLGNYDPYFKGIEKIDDLTEFKNRLGG